MSSYELECKYKLLGERLYTTAMYGSKVRCAVCHKLDEHANVDEIDAAVLIVEGINQVDDETFHYVTPQHRECTLRYQINKVAPEL